MKLIREYGTTVAILLIGGAIIARMIFPGAHPLVGQMAPEFALTDVAGNPVTLKDHLGKDVVVLDFWASWCPPCREGLPKLDALADHFAGQAVAIYGVNIGETAAQAKDFRDGQGLDLPVLLDESGLVAEDYGVTGIPQTVIIDKSGRVHEVHVGISPGFETSIQTEIETLLAAPAAS